MLHEWWVLRAFNRGTIIVLLVTALDSFGYFGIQGVLFNLYLLRLGLGAELIGLLIASGQLTWAAVALPAGAVGRRFGLRVALVAGGALSALGMGLVLLVELLPGSLWLPWLFGSWSILWIGAALYSVNSPPYLMHVTTAATRHQAFAAQGAVIAFMGFGGSLAGGLLPGLFAAVTGASLAQPAPYRYALWAAPLAYLLCALLWCGAQPVAPVKQAPTARASDKPLGLFGFLVLLVLLQTASEGAMLTFGNVYLDLHLGVPTVLIGTILAAGQLLSVVGILAVPYLLRRHGAPTTLLWTTLGLGATLLPLALVKSWLPATLGLIGIILLSAMNGPLRTVFSQEIVLPRWRTTTSALLTIGMALGWASAAALGGYLIAQRGFSPLFLISAGLALVAALLLLGYLRLQPHASMDVVPEVAE